MSIPVSTIHLRERHKQEHIFRVLLETSQMSSVLNSRRIMDYNNPELTINQQAYSSYSWLYMGPVLFPYS